MTSDGRILVKISKESRWGEGVLSNQVFQNFAQLAVERRARPIFGGRWLKVRLPGQRAPVACLWPKVEFFGCSTVFLLGEGVKYL